MSQLKVVTGVIYVPAHEYINAVGRIVFPGNVTETARRSVFARNGAIKTHPSGSGHEACKSHGVFPVVIKTHRGSRQSVLRRKCDKTKPLARRGGAANGA